MTMAITVKRPRGTGIMANVRVEFAFSASEQYHQKTRMIIAITIL